MNPTYRNSDRIFCAAVALLTLLHLGTPAWALPTDYTVEHGSVTSEASGSEQHFHIDSDQSILSFPQFSISPSETVAFHFHTGNPAVSSVLNRVTGGQLSTIAGVLLSNGQVFLVNPAGILIADTARIDTAGFVASALNITNENFLAGNWNFEQDPGFAPASVVNQGTILARPGDLIGLLGGAVQNSGLLVAELGSVALVSGARATLSFDQGGWLAVAVSEPLQQLAVGPDGQPVDSAVTQTGSIFAPGGQILIHARAVEGLFNRLVSLPSGVIEAVTVVARNGRIELVGEGGALYHAGTLRTDGTAEAPDGGEISVRGSRIEQAGLITANAAENGQAGEVSLTARDSVALKPGSRLEAKASGADGQGGSVRVASEQPKQSGLVQFEEGSVIDVSGGSVSGDAGSVELSAAELQFAGQAVAQAASGYFGGRLLVDPLFLIFNTTAQVAPPDNGTGTPDISFGDPPAAGTTIVEIADIVAFAQAFFQAVNDITINAAIVMGAGNSLRLEAGRNITQNADVTVSGAGTVTLIADADSNGSGAFVMSAGTSIASETGDIVVSNGGPMELRDITSASGDIVALSEGNLIIRGPSTISTGGAGSIFLMADSDLEGHGHFSMDSGSALMTDTGAIVVFSALFSDPSEAELELRTVTSTSGEIVALSGRGVRVRGAISTGGSGGILLDGDFDLNGSGTVRMDPGGVSSLTTAEGPIELLGGNADMNLREITSGSGDVCVHSADTINVRGPITTGGDGMITLWADSDGSGVGTVNQDGSSDDITTAAGQILLWGAGSMTVENLTSTSGNIFVWVSNPTADLRLDGLVSTGGSVELFAGDDIRDGNGGALNVSAGGNAEFTALNGTIGTTGNPLDVLIGGILDVGAGGIAGGASINIAGAVGGGVGGSPPTPPHLVTALGLPAGGPATPGTVRLNGIPMALIGALGAGFDADLICITGAGGGGGGGGGGAPPILPPVISALTGLGELFDFLFEVELRRRYRGFVI